jgi:hypothetical protein
MLRNVDFSPPPRPEEHVLEGAGFQKTNEAGFIDNNGARVVREFGKLCVCWEKGVIMMLALLLSRTAKREGHYRATYVIDNDALDRILFRRPHLILEGATTGDVFDPEADHLALPQSVASSC